MELPSEVFNLDGSRWKRAIADSHAIVTISHSTTRGHKVSHERINARHSTLSWTEHTPSGLLALYRHPGYAVTARPGYVLSITLDQIAWFGTFVRDQGPGVQGPNGPFRAGAWRDTSPDLFVALVSAC